VSDDQKHGHGAALHQEDPDTHFGRRAVLQAAIGAGLGATLLSTLYVGAGLIPKKEVTPESEPIAAGDILVYSQGDKKDQPINAADLQANTLQIIAYPMNPKTRVVKGGEANNTVILVKLDPSKFDAVTAKLVTEGVVAYSGVCKHLGCIVSNWDASKSEFVCPCHQGHYNPYQGGKVMSGPPPKAIPQLPIKIEGGQIVVAGDFVDKPGKEA